MEPWIIITHLHSLFYFEERGRKRPQQLILLLLNNHSLWIIIIQLPKSHRHVLSVYPLNYINNQDLTKNKSK